MFLPSTNICIHYKKGEFSLCYEVLQLVINMPSTSKWSLVVRLWLVQFNAISCLCEHCLGDIMRYKNLFQLTSTCEDSFIAVKIVETTFHLVLVGDFSNLVYQEICLQLVSHNDIKS